MVFNGANVAEKFDVSANGSRVRFTRDVGNVTMDLNGVEAIDLNALGGADTITVNDLTGTDLTTVNLDLAAVAGAATGDGQADTVIVNGTNGDDTIQVLTVGNGTTVADRGPASRREHHRRGGGERPLTVNALGGNDTVDASRPARRS